MGLQVHREGLPLKLLINDLRLIVNYVQVVHGVYTLRSVLYTAVKELQSVFN